MRGAHRPSVTTILRVNDGALLAHTRPFCALFGKRGEPRFDRFLMRVNQVEVCGINKQVCSHFGEEDGAVSSNGAPMRANIALWFMATSPEQEPGLEGL
jgi:hypothetical protein